MSDFISNLQARIAVINQMIAGARALERRKLQAERSVLEDKLRRAIAFSPANEVSGSP